MAQDVNNFCKTGGDNSTSCLAAVADILRHVEAARLVFNGHQLRVGGDELAEDERLGPILYAPRSMRR